MIFLALMSNQLYLWNTHGIRNNLSITQIILDLRRVANELTKLGYRFNNITPIGEPTTEDVLLAFQNRFALPAILEEFYRHVSYVDFNGTPPDEWTGCEFPDPLIIFPASDALAELNEYDQNKEEYIEMFGGFRFPLAPDAYHKANVSGGMWYNIPFFPQPLKSDPVIRDLPYPVRTFTDYLTLALKWGGFPGLMKVKSHTWPLIDLQKEG